MVITRLLAPQRAWIVITITCLIFAGISHWLPWPYYGALFSLLHPRNFTVSDIGGAILAISQWTQARSFSSMPSNGNALWYKEAASNWVTEYLPIGNGYLGGESFRSIFTHSPY